MITSFTFSSIFGGSNLAMTHLLVNSLIILQDAMVQNLMDENISGKEKYGKFAILNCHDTQKL